MAFAAAQSGVEALGMVGHAQMEFFCNYAMTPDAEKSFVAEMAVLKAQYAGKMDLFCGIELDYFSPEPELPYDYRIGSGGFAACRVIGNIEIFHLTENCPLFPMIIGLDPSTILNRKGM